MPDQLGRQFGPYRLLHLLGRGGFAEVYLAEHVHLKIQAAVKVLHGQMTAQDVQAFTTEAQTIASLRHPHILRILDFGFEQTLPFLVMEYATGGTLRDRHPAGSQVPLATAVAYIKQVASALAYAHGKKLIHRDVKPENMLMDTNGTVLLGDFGIVVTAHSTASMKTIDKTGTVHYMAPEQIKGQPRPASDQYALAIVVYEWLCGERPFTGDSFVEIAMQHLTEQPPSLQVKGVLVSTEVEEVILKALSKDPQQRFPDILAFANALQQASQAVNDPTMEPTQQANPPSPALKAQATQTPERFTQEEIKGSTQAQSSSSPLLTYTGHSDKIQSVAWSPDGTHIASVASDGVHIWHASTGKHLLTYSKNSSSQNSTVSWSPDGNQIVFSFWDAKVKILNANTGEDILTYEGHSRFVRKASWSPDGTSIISCDTDNIIQVWDAKTGQTLLTYRGHTPSATLSERIDIVRWAPDSKRIFSDSYDHPMQIWDVKTGKRILQCEHTKNRRYAAAWSSDGTRIVAGGTSPCLQAWDTTTGKQILTYCDYHDSIEAVAWSPNGNWIVSGDRKGIAKIWDAETGTLLFTYRGHTKEITDVTWSPDSTRVASASKDGTVQVWQAPLGESISVQSAAFPTEHLMQATLEEVEVLPLQSLPLALKETPLFTYWGHNQNEVYRIAWSLDGRYIASIDKDNIQIWNAQTGKILSTIPRRARGSITNIHWSPASRLIALSEIGSKAPIEIWDAHQGNLMYTSKEQKEFIYTAAWSPDGRYIVTGDKAGEIHEWEVSTGSTLRFYKGHPGQVNAIAWSPDGKYIISGSGNRALGDNGKVQVWEIRTGRRLFFHEEKDVGLSVAWSPNNKYIAFSFVFGPLQVWEAPQGKLLFSDSTMPAHYLRTVIWSPDSQYIACTTSVNRLYIWNVLTGALLYRHDFDDHIEIAWPPNRIHIATAKVGIHVWQGGEQNTNDVSFQESSKKHITKQEQQAEKEQQHTRIGQAEQFLQHGQNRAAGAIAGVLFESALKKLCDRHAILYPEKAGLRLLIQNLRKADVITSEEASHMTHLASIRNKCAHANPISEQEVRLLVEEVKKFIDRVNDEA